MFNILLYLETSFTCLFLLCFSLTKLKKSLGAAQEIRAFKHVIIAGIFLQVLDILWIVGEKSAHPFFPWANSLLNSLYMGTTGIQAFFWFTFVELTLVQNSQQVRKIIQLGCIPAVILIFLSACSPWTHWLFYINDDNVYQRGNLYLVQLIITHAYLLVAAGHAMIHGMWEQNKSKQKTDFVLASFAVLPLLGGGLQLLFFGLSTSLIASSLSILMVLVNFLDSQISRDPLTGLNNRRRTDEYLDKRLANPSKMKNMVIFLADINLFKQINDKFGHSEGDRALIETADVLKDVCSRFNAFLSRFGGDEFCIIWKRPENARPEDLMLAIQQGIAKRCAEKKLPYTLSITLGYGIPNAPDEPVSDILRRADEMLYKNKEIAKSTR